MGKEKERNDDSQTSSYGAGIKTLMHSYEMLHRCTLRYCKRRERKINVNGTGKREQDQSFETGYTLYG